MSYTKRSMTMEWSSAGMTAAFATGALTWSILMFRENTPKADIIVGCAMAGAVVLSLARMVLA